MVPHIIIVKLVRAAVSFIVNSVGDAACPSWKSVGSELGGFRVAIKREDDEWFIGFHKGAGAGRYRSDGWTITTLVSKMTNGLADQLDDEVQELAHHICAAL